MEQERNARPDFPLLEVKYVDAVSPIVEAVRELGREEARLRAAGNPSDCAKVVPFPLKQEATGSN